MIIAYEDISGYIIRKYYGSFPKILQSISTLNVKTTHHLTFHAKVACKFFTVSDNETPSPPEILKGDSFAENRTRERAPGEEARPNPKHKNTRHSC